MRTLEINYKLNFYNGKTTQGPSETITVETGDIEEIIEYFLSKLPSGVKPFLAMTTYALTNAKVEAWDGSDYSHGDETLFFTLKGFSEDELQAIYNKLTN